MDLLEHYQQWLYVNKFKTSKAKKWIKEIEIDAITFSQVVMYEEYNIKVEVKDLKLQNKINKYKSKLLK